MQRYIAKNQYMNLNIKDILLTQNKVEMEGQRKEKQMEQLEIKKMMNQNQAISNITVNVSGMNMPVKWQSLSGRKEKKSNIQLNPIYRNTL